jgi:hypothetical protein
MLILNELEQGGFCTVVTGAAQKLLKEWQENETGWQSVSDRQ